MGRARSPSAASPTVSSSNGRRPAGAASRRARPRPGTTIARTGKARRRRSRSVSRRRTTSSRAGGSRARSMESRSRSTGRSRGSRGPAGRATSGSRISRSAAVRSTSRTCSSRGAALEADGSRTDQRRLRDNCKRTLSARRGVGYHGWVTFPVRLEPLMRPALLFLVACLVSSLTLASSALASSPSLVISEIYAARGNAGALYVNDYVELFNRGSSTVDVSAWSVQYATAAGNTWSATPLAGSVAPGRHLLVQLGPTGTVGSPLPAPDVTGTTNLAASGGKIALVHDTAAILCGASPGSCTGVATLQDLVGYGSATDYEGTAAAPALDATTAAVRAGGGCTDTDSNTADFTGGAPAPQTSAASAAPCAGTPPSGSSVQPVAIDANVAPVISIALEHPSISFGQVVTGTVPSPLSERITVFSTRS